MKKTILAAIVVAGMVTSTTEAQENIQLGIEGTPHMSWLINQDDMDNSKFEYLSTFGSSFGVSGQYNFAESNMGIGLNVLYSFQGQRFKLDGVERVKKLEYVKIPLMFVFGSDRTADWMFIGKIGPQIGSLANAKITDKDGNEIISDQGNAYEDVEFGAVASAGVGCKLSPLVLLDFAVRFDYGFTDAENKDYHKNINDPLDVINNGSTMINRAMTYNSTAGITIGLRFQLE